jgi:hypothetical protein
MRVETNRKILSVVLVSRTTWRVFHDSLRSYVLKKERVVLPIDLRGKGSKLLEDCSLFQTEITNS